MERVLVEYAANAVWQLPVLAAGAWLLIRVARPAVAVQYRIWVAVLALAVLLPLRGAFAGSGADAVGGLGNAGPSTSRATDARFAQDDNLKTEAGSFAALRTGSSKKMASADFSHAQDDNVKTASQRVSKSAGQQKARSGSFDGASNMTPAYSSYPQVDNDPIAAGIAAGGAAGRDGWMGDAMGEPGGLVMGSLSGTRGTSWAGWGISALARVRRIEVNATTAEWIAGVYLAVMLLGLLRIALAWRTARRLVRDSDEAPLTDEERTAVAECARRMGVAAPEVREMPVREADALAGPVVVGMTHPVLLWPEVFARELLAAGRGDEMTATLCHEMAHIRRRDYLMNLACEAVAVPLRWHPVTYGVERRIRSTREMACDAMAAEAMESETQYASCLLRLAESMVAGGAMVEQAGAMGLFNGNVLEERVMRLMRTEKAMSARAKVARGMAGVAAMTAAVALAGMFHVVPAWAQTAAEQGSSQVSEARPGAPTGKAAPEIEAAPVAPKATPSPESPVIAPGQKLNLHVVAPVHVKLLKIAPDKVVVLGVTPNVHVVTAVHDTIKLSKLAPVVAVAPVIALDPAPQTQPAPASEPAPAVAPTPAPAPAPKVEPAPKAEPAPAPYHHEAIVSKDGKVYAWADGKWHELTPAERARLEKQLEEAQKKIAAETARVDSPEFREQMERSVREAMDAQRKIQSGEIQKQLAEAQARLNSPEFKKQLTEAQSKAMADMQRELNSAEFQAKMAEAQKQLAEAMAKMQSPEFRKQMEETQQKALSNMDVQKQMAEAQKQMAEVTARLNSQEFKEQIDRAVREATNGEVQKQMAEAQKDLQKQLDALKATDKNGPQQ